MKRVKLIRAESLLVSHLRYGTCLEFGINVLILYLCSFPLSHDLVFRFQDEMEGSSGEEVEEEEEIEEELEDDAEGGDGEENEEEGKEDEENGGKIIFDVDIEYFGLSGGKCVGH